MKTIDLTPLYRNSVGFDRLSSLLEGASRNGNFNTSYPPYNIELLDEDRYAVTLAVAGFELNELDILVENDTLTVKGEKAGEKETHNYLYQGIATRSFERKFNLSDHVEITGARLNNGLLVIELLHELPEAMKPRHVEISTTAHAGKKRLGSDKAA